MKTNLSQCMMFFECVNPTWVRTLNPHHRDYSSGGSTGGEGALLAMDGSALGWGSDIGGSLRIPASYCGIYSFKPGFGRISSLGCRGTERFLSGPTSEGPDAPDETLTGIDTTQACSQGSRQCAPCAALSHGMCPTWRLHVA